MLWEAFDRVCGRRLKLLLPLREISMGVRADNQRRDRNASFKIVPERLSLHSLSSVSMPSGMVDQAAVGADNGGQDWP